MEISNVPKRLLRLLVLPLLLTTFLTLLAGCGKQDQSNGKGDASVEERKQNKIKSDK